jgi:hypothetical protein
MKKTEREKERGAWQCFERGGGVERERRGDRERDNVCIWQCFVSQSKDYLCVSKEREKRVCVNWQKDFLVRIDERERESEREELLWQFLNSCNITIQIPQFLLFLALSVYSAVKFQLCFCFLIKQFRDNFDDS